MGGGLEGWGKKESSMRRVKVKMRNTENAETVGATVEILLWEGARRGGK